MTTPLNGSTSLDLTIKLLVDAYPPLETRAGYNGKSMAFLAVNDTCVRDQCLIKSRNDEKILPTWAYSEASSVA